MNRIFRIIWSQTLSAWVVVSELSTRRGKRSGGGTVVDERVAAPAVVPGHDMAGRSPPAAPWPLRAGILLALLAMYAPAEAASRYWDFNGTSVGRGGTGTWDTTSPFWSPNGDGVSGPYSAWNNAALDDAFFGGTAGTVTLGTGITVHSLTFETTGYTITGNTLTLGGVTPTITTNAGVTATIGSIIAGTQGLTKAGTGGLILNGVNTFSGDVNVTGGALSLNGDAALGAASNGVTLAGGTGLASTGALAATRTVTLGTGALVGISGAGVGSARYTGAGGLNTAVGVTLSNDANDYTGQTTFNSGSGGHAFTSIADLGVASSMGAPVTVANGTIVVNSGGFFTTAQYVGNGDSSNRNWTFGGNTGLVNSGTGTLTLTGNFTGLGSINASTADLGLSGIMSGAVGASFTGGGVGRTITLGTANTYSGATSISNVTVRAGSLTNAGTASSLGTNSSIAINNNGVLSYTGTGNSSDRTWSINGAGTVRNDGSGALALSGAVTFNAGAPADTFALGGSFTGVNTLSSVISGVGDVTGNGSGTWVLGGANTYTGTTTVSSGTLQAGNAQAFGIANGAVVNGGTLDLNNFSMEVPSLSGTGGTVALGSATLTLNGGSAINTSYAGTITGSGGITKVGASTQTLSGTNTYTGATTVNGGTLRLNFGAAGAPASNIISSASTLNMGGGTLNAIGANGVANTQTFSGFNILAGNNTIGATAGTGGSMTINLGDITRTGGLVNFNLPSSGNITTTDTTLGGWATVNGTNYAKVVGGNILAFTAADYVNKDDASTWLNNEILSDAGGSANTAYFSTVSGSKQIGGLQYTAAANSTVTVGAGNTLGVDGTIIVAPSVGTFNQTITGGSLTGTLGGGVLGIQQNGGGNFTIASQIVDNGGSIGFTKAGTGLVTLTNNTSNYTGPTTVSGGTLSVTSIGNGGAASAIGASSAASSNLVLEGSTLRYTGGTTTSDRGFTNAKAGLNLGGIIEVTNAATNLTFNGLVTSPDGANLTKIGAGTLTLANGANDYDGATIVSGGTLAVDTLANGSLVSGIGASSSASDNLVVNGGTLDYTGGTVSSDRGFTVGVIGAGGSTGSIGVSNAASTLTLSGTAIGDDGFAKVGAGTLVLSGTNTYTSSTTVNAGTLQAGSTQAFGVDNSMTVATGATLDLNGFNNTVAGLSGSGTVTLGSATLLSSLGNGVFSGTISGTGGFTRTDSGAFGGQVITGCNNTYTGVTSLINGRLSVDCLANGGVASAIGASSSASSNLLFNNGNLSYTGGNVNIDRGLTLQGGGYGVLIVSNAATTLGIGGPVVGGGTLYKRGPGTLVLSGNNTYTGGTVVDEAGILRAGSATAFGTGGVTMGNIAGATLDLGGFNATVAWLNGGGTTGGNINLGAQTLTLSTGNNAAGIAYAGVISGTGNLVDNGAQAQWLTGCNSSYTGTTTINNGSLAVSCLTNGGSNSSIGASSSAAGNLTINGGTLYYGGVGNNSDRLFTLGTAGGALNASGTGALNLTNTGAIALTGTNAARTFTLTGTNTGTNILSAQLNNNGTGVTSLSKAGTGTWRLTNNSSAYTGVTNISGGVLEVSKLANGGVASGIGASSNAAANLVIGNGSTLRYTGTGDNTDRLFTLAAGTTFIESSGTGAINFTNTGAIALSGTNTPRTIALGGTNTGNNTLAATIADNGTGVTTLAKNDSGTWMLTGNNTYTGNTVINDGNLMIGNGGTSGNLGAGNVIVNSPTSTLSMNRSDTVVFNAAMSGPGTFAQVGTGTTTLTANNSIGATTVSAGTLDVNGVLNTGTIAMSGTSTLNVDGTVQAAGGTAAVLTGDAGNSTINVNSGATLRASGDLGDGSDSLNVTGTLDTGAATLSLGAGNDTLTLNDGAVITGPGVDGGAGSNDNLVVNNALALTFGGTGVNGFEQLTKNNTGVLTLTNNQSYSAGTVINGGTLDVTGTMETPTVSMADGTTLTVDGTVQGMGGTVATLTGSAGSNTINVNSGATLRASGDLGDGVDNLTLSGTLDTGAAALSLGAGDETVTLHDGAAISGVGIDAGTGSDALVLDNALTLSFDGSQTAGFETLLKQNTGTATMTGTQSFSAGTTIAGGTLAVAGALQTSTIAMTDGTALTVDGSLQAAGGTAAVVTGSAGTNTVTVGAGGMLLANGDLGAGNDVLDVAGTLNTGTGVFALGDGDDTLTIHDNTNIIGTVSAGAGNDTFNTDIATVADLGAVQGFQTLSKTGAGELNINGTMSSDFTTVDVLDGTLNVTAAGAVVAAAGNTLDTDVASGATLNVDGSYGCGAGNDTMTVSGTVSGSGTIDLCGGDDTLTLQDGAVLNNTISGGTGSDTLVLDNAAALTFDAGKTTNFELLQKDDTGTATLTGSQSFTGGTTINGGTLAVAGTLETPTIALADDTALTVDGTVQAAGGTQATITGSAGDNTVTVGAGGTLLADGDLGGGDDTLDVAGTLDTGAGVFALGDGDDTLTIHDNTDIGTVSAGAGNNTLNTDIDTVADLGAVQGFQTLSKTGAGELNINGTMSSDFTTVDVLDGTLNVTAAGAVVAAAGNTLDTDVASGATLNVDGSYSCGAGNDTMTVSGTVSGSGTINLCGGDDTLTLNDGANLSGLVNPIDGDAGTGDTVVLNNAGAMTLDAGEVANFEVLQKDNTGEATLTGAQSYSGGTLLNDGTLTVDGTLDTPSVAMSDGAVLNVNNLLEASGGTAAVITGSAGANTVNVATGALLVASGDLGDGADVLDVAGTLDTNGGVLSLGDGSDTFTIHDGTVVQGTVDGGAGVDTFNPDINASADLGALTNFEILTKTGTGVLNVNGPGQSDFVQVNVLDGTLNIGAAGGIGGVQDATVANGATLNMDGDLGFTSGDDTLTVAGTVTGSGTLDMGDGDDTFTIQDGADLSGLATPVNGGAGNDTFVADLAGSAVLGGAVNFETLTKTNTGTLHVNGPAMSVFSTVNVDGGTLDIGAGGSLTGVQSATVLNGASLNVDGSVDFTPGADTFIVAGNVRGLGTINMLDGDDNLIIQDGADLSGLSTPIDGGAGNDTLTADIAGSATLGGATNFETLTKTNTGTLTVAGPALSDFTTVNADGGTLDIGAAGSVSGVVTTTVATGATLNVDGSFAGSAGDDTMTVAGIVSGSGTIDFGDGDDVLTLNDGADLSGFSGTLDGGAHSAGDTVVLNDATDLTFGAGTVTNFEFLSKTNTGTARLTGNQSFSGGTTISGGTLDVAGTLETPTIALADDTALTVDGTVQAADPTATVITGSAGVNTVTVAAGGTLLASGDLGDGEDTLDVSGTLNTNGGVFMLGAGDDNFVVHDGTVVLGTIDGGAGLDTRTYDINTTADLGALVNFEGVTKTGTGVLNITGPGVTDLQQVSVLGGTMNIGPAGDVVAIAGTPLDTVVASGATLNVDGSFGCGDSSDTMTVAGTVSGSGTIDMCGGDDTLTLQDGAVLNTTIDGGNHDAGDTVVLDNAAAMSFDTGHTINFEFLQKNNVGEATLTGTQAFSGGTTVNAGTLTVAGQLDTPSVAMADGSVLNVNGTVQAAGGTAVALSGSAGTNTVTVAAGGTLRATGDLGDGADVLDVAGTLDTESGIVALGAGDDTMTIHDDTIIAGTVTGGAGNDTFNADIATTADLGAVQDFETLSKTGAGVLNVNGPASSDFTSVNVLGGSLDVTANGSIAAQATTVAAGATLQVEGHYTGTSGDDTFTSMGTVRGAFDFGAGNDTVAFIGGDPSGVTALDGGAGNDRLSFSALTLQSETLPALAGWERVELLNGSALTLDAPLDLDGGVLAIDATSQLSANAGAALGGSVENAGLIDVETNRLSISGDYTGNNGTLQTIVSPENLSAGGLDINGDVRGTTSVVFNSDGSQVVGAGKVSILVISSPNDNPSTAGSFVPANTVNGAVRLDGSVLPWTFEQQADHNWYLDAQAGLLPEFPGYAILPTLGALTARQEDDVVHQRMSAVRDTEQPVCGHKHEANQNTDHADFKMSDDCHGFWVAAAGSSTDLGADPGFAASGSDVGMYVGVDYAGDESAGQTVRIGAFAGFLHGNYWTTGVNSTALPGIGASATRLDTSVGGGYTSIHWTNGAYVDVVVSGQGSSALVRTAGGFAESLSGNGVALSAQMGQRHRLENGWIIEPQLRLSASQTDWNDKLDSNGRQLTFTNNWVSSARAGMRVEKTFTTDSGALIRPWMSLAIENTFHQAVNGLQVSEPGSGAAGLALPNQDLGTTARLDAGVEAKLNAKVSLFGVLSASHSLHGSDFRERAANVGIRVRW